MFFKISKHLTKPIVNFVKYYAKTSNSFAFGLYIDKKIKINLKYYIETMIFIMFNIKQMPYKKYNTKGRKKKV
jgi:hypothetical protein